MNTSTSVPVLFPDSFFQDAVLLQCWLQNDFTAICVLAREFSSVVTDKGQQTPHLHLDLKTEIRYVLVSIFVNSTPFDTHDIGFYDTSK